jgi:hypothetical protein
MGAQRILTNEARQPGQAELPNQVQAARGSDREEICEKITLNEDWGLSLFVSVRFFSETNPQGWDAARCCGCLPWRPHCRA